MEVNGIKMHFAEKGEGPVVLFLHGFPDLWYCWRNQILNLSELGYHAVAPDLRGYGDTQVLGHDHDKASRYTVLELVESTKCRLSSLQVTLACYTHSRQRRTISSTVVSSKMCHLWRKWKCFLGLDTSASQQRQQTESTLKFITLFTSSQTDRSSFLSLRNRVFYVETRIKSHLCVCARVLCLTQLMVVNLIWSTWSLSQVTSYYSCELSSSTFL